MRGLGPESLAALMRLQVRCPQNRLNYDCITARGCDSARPSAPFSALFVVCCLSLWRRLAVCFTLRTSPQIVYSTTTAEPTIS